jgi:hypothetical protein
MPAVARTEGIGMMAETRMSCPTYRNYVNMFALDQKLNRLIKPSSAVHGVTVGVRTIGVSESGQCPLWANYGAARWGISLFASGESLPIRKEQ